MRLTCSICLSTTKHVCSLFLSYVWVLYGVIYNRDLTPLITFLDNKHKDWTLFSQNWNRIGCVMVSVLVSSVVDRGFETIKLVFVASPLGTQHKGERAKIGWLAIRILCPSGTTCLSTDCCFSELAM